LKEGTGEKNMYLENFVNDCYARGLTPQTIATYRSNVSSFLEFLDKDPVDIHMNDLRGFLAFLRAKKYVVGRDHRQGVAPATLDSTFSAISSFYEFLSWEDLTVANPVLKFRKRYIRTKEQRNGENTRQLISVNRMRDLLALTREFDDILAEAIITFGAKTGLRKGELIAMNIQDLNFENYQFTVPPKRKRSSRIGFMDAETVQVLYRYLEWREPRAKTNALWLSPTGYRIGRNENGPCEIIKKYARILGIHDDNGPLIKKYTTHCLRHWFTTHTGRLGMKREYIKELRGDSIKDAIDIYNHIDTELLRESYLQHIPQFNHVDLKQTKLFI
jgi:integrase/recombinase XerD